MESLEKLQGKTNSPILSDDEKEESDRVKTYRLIKNAVDDVVKSENDPDQIVVLVEINNQRYWFDISGSDFNKFLQVRAFEKYDEIFSKTDLELAIKQYHAKHTLFNSTKIKPTFQRFAYLKNENTIYYDPNRQDCKLVKITGDSVNLIDYDVSTNPIFVKNPNTWITNPHLDFKMTEEDALEQFVNLFHISNEDKLVFKVHLITYFFTGFPIPIMVFNGEQGTAKSTTAKAIKYMLDPEKLEVLALPEKEEDLVIAALKHAFLFFDNVGGIREELSNSICRMITGGGNSKRALYTNTDEVTINLMSKIGMNGISPGIHKPDLLRRCVMYELTPIAQKDKKTDSEVKEEIENLRPQLLGQIFNILKKTLSTKDVIKKTIEKKPTMADFAIWGEAISQAMGNKPQEFIDRYLQKMDMSNAALFDRYPLIDEILGIVKGADNKLSVTIKELHEKLKNRCKEMVERHNGLYEVVDHEKLKNVPKNAAELGKKVRELAPTIRSLGYRVDFKQITKSDDEKRGSSQVIIEKIQGGVGLDDYT